MMEIELRNQLAEIILESLKDPSSLSPVEMLELLCKIWEGPTSGKTTILDIKPYTTLPAYKSLISKSIFDVSPRDAKSNNLPQLKREYLNEIKEIHTKAVAACEIIRDIRENPDWDKLTPVEKGFRLGAFLFNQHLFFETHEILEEHWLEENGPLRPLLQGFIQIAVGFYHLLNQNYAGASSLLKDGTSRMEPFLPRESGLELEAFYLQTRKCLIMMENLGKDRIHQFEMSMIPKISITPKKLIHKESL